MRVIKLRAAPTTMGVKPMRSAQALERWLQEVYGLKIHRDFDWYFRNQQGEFHIHFYGKRFDRIEGLDTVLILKWQAEFE